MALGQVYQAEMLKTVVLAWEYTNDFVHAFFSQKVIHSGITMTFFLGHNLVFVRFL